MGNDKFDTSVEELVTKAEKAEKSEDALRFSQAACNVANARISAREGKKEVGK